MKLELDFTNNTIKVLEPAEIGELIKELKAMFPNDGYLKWTIINDVSFTYNPTYTPPLNVPYYFPVDFTITT